MIKTQADARLTRMAEVAADFGNVCWFTNLDISKRHEDLILYKTYNPRGLPEVRELRRHRGQPGRYADIPVDYDGAMGVPITFLDKYNPDQFEILGNSRELRTPMAEDRQRRAPTSRRT